MEAAELPQPLPLNITTQRLQLGAILVRDGELSVQQLEDALAEKESSGRRLGEIVVERGYCTSAAVARALAEQYDLDFIDLATEQADDSAVALLTEKLARRYQALPIRFESESTVLVAVADPTNILNSDDLRLALGLNVKLVVAAGADLASALSRHYRVSVELDDADAVEEPDDGLEDVRDEATTAPAIKLVNSLVAQAIEDGASDVHFEPQASGMIVRARIDGVTRRIADIPKAMQPSVTSRLKIMGELDIADKRSPQDGRVSISFSGVPMDLRMAVLPTTHGEQVVLRIMQRASQRRSLADLGMSDEAESVFARAIQQPYGLILACGPTGSGKTTTLYAALDVLNEEGRVLTTIEDPVEYQMPGVSQIEVNTRAGLTFARGLRTILRSDPDVLLVGEVRDEETARIATQAAMTGHLVLTTLHTPNAASSIARLKDMGVEPSLLATSLNCIVAQRLARRLCQVCREPNEPRADELVSLGASERGEGTFHRAKGCAQCSGTGYSGRVALYEVMAFQGRLRRLVEASTEEIFAAAVDMGMTTLREYGLRLCRQGISSLDEVRRVTGDRLT